MVFLVDKYKTDTLSKVISQKKLKDNLKEQIKQHKKFEYHSKTF